LRLIGLGGAGGGFFFKEWIEQGAIIVWLFYGRRDRLFPGRKMTRVGRPVVRAVPIRNAARNIHMGSLETGSQILCKSPESRIKAFAVEARFVDRIKKEPGLTGPS
jgi:hypothetical protein